MRLNSCSIWPKYVIILASVTLVCQSAGYEKDVRDNFHNGRKLGSKKLGLLRNGIGAIE